METKALDQVLAQLRSAVARTGINSMTPATAAAVNKPADFGAVLKASLDHVNATQQQAANLARDFELGAPGASLQDVMVSIQKANISFQQTVQVRNRLLESYQELMRMQV